MPFADDYEFELLTNDAVPVVIEELEHQLNLEENANICRCQDCVLDMAAFALNKVKPSYRSTYTGVIYSQQLYNDEEIHKSIIDAVTSAIERINNNPLHSN